MLSSQAVPPLVQSHCPNQLFYESSVLLTDCPPNRRSSISIVPLLVRLPSQPSSESIVLLVIRLAITRPRSNSFLAELAVFHSIFDTQLCCPFESFDELSSHVED